MAANKPKAEPVLETKAAQEQAEVEAQVEVESLAEVRVLIDCELGKANTLAKIRSSQIRELKALGYVDNEPSAIAYLKEGQ